MATYRSERVTAGAGQRAYPDLLTASPPDSHTLASPEILPLQSSEDIVRLRRHVRESTLAIRLSLVDQTKFVTAASELARNTVTYGGGGEAQVQILANGSRQGIRIRFIDQGPGIADVEQALSDGFTSGNGMGLGLGGARRLADEFELETKLGVGTTVTITTWTTF
jgi:serine/threonine-protein kinase RsbT